MYKREKIVWNLIDTEQFTRSKIAELTGISVAGVHEISKQRPEPNNGVHCDDECIFNYCPDPKICETKGCKNKR